MKLALVFPGCHRRGGVERNMWEAARRWRRDHEVTVVATDVDAAELDAVHILPVPVADGARPLRFGRAAREVYRVEDYDHVISFGAQPVPATVAWVGSVHRAWLEASRRHPGRSRLHDPRLRYLLPRHQELLFVERRYFGEPRPVTVTVSDHVGQDLTRLYGVPADGLMTVHNGFDPVQFDPARRTSERAAARLRWQLPGDAVVLCMVANELPRKGYDVLLEAVARVPDPRLHVLLAGSADPGRYADLTARLGLADRVRWAGPQSDVGLVHAAADVFVLPTKYEAFCVAIVEALGSGLPVVTTDVPGASDTVTDGVNGLLQSDPDDVDELAALLARVAEDPIRAALTAAARPAVEHLTWSHLLDSAIDRLARRAH